MLAPDHQDQLIAIVTSQVVPGRLMAADVANIGQAERSNGKAFSVSASGESVMINGAKNIVADVEATNGIMLVKDALILTLCK